MTNGGPNLCSNETLNRTLNRVVDSLDTTNTELKATNIAVGKLESRLETWQETKCQAHEDDIKDLQVSGRATREKLIVTAVKMSLLVGMVSIAAAALANHLFTRGVSGG